MEGLRDRLQRLHGPVDRHRRRGRAERCRAALAAGAGGAPRARPAGHRRHGRVALPHRLARADRRGVAAARGGLPGRVGDRAPVRRPRATRRPSHRPVAHRRRGRVHAARRHHGRHPASRAAGRPAAADDLQHPGQPAGRRRLVDHLHAHHHRLPADAVPPGEPSDRALGPSARQRRRGPERVRRQQRRPAFLRGRDRSRRDRAGDRRPALHPDLRHRAVRQRVRPGRRRQDQDREPDGRPQARPPAGQRRTGHHDPDRTTPTRATCASPCSTASPTTSGAPATVRHRATSARSASCRPITGLSSTVPTKEYDYHVNIGQNFDSPWLPTQFPVSAIDAARRLALRQLDDGRDVLRRGPARRRDELRHDRRGARLRPRGDEHLTPGQRHDGHPAHRAAAGPLHVGPHPGDARDGRVHRAVPEGRRPPELPPRQRRLRARQLGGRQRQRHPGGVPRRELPGAR